LVWYHAAHRLRPLVGWEAAYLASNRVGAVTIEAREALCEGICSVLASLPNSQRARPLQILFNPTIECLRTMTKMADESVASVQKNDQSYLGPILVRVADEIRILSTMVRTYSRGTSETSDMQDQGSQTPAGEDPYLTVLRQAWPSISHIAETFNKNEVRLLAKCCRFLGRVLTDVLVSYITECVRGLGKVSR
jgi:hypothetical protein